MIVRVAGLVCSVFTAVMASSQEQTIMSPENPNSFVRPEGNLPTLADLLTIEGRGSIFYSYARETDISLRFTQSTNEGEGTTLFVPTNKAIQALARKPHEDPEDDTVGVSDAEHEAISRSNVQRWVGAHVIPNANVDFTYPNPYDTLTEGATITFKAIKADRHLAHEPIIDTDAAHFASVKGPVSSGQIPQLDTDAAHLSNVKGPSPQINNKEPIWKRYELNDGIHIIAERIASNGVMYLIDGTVSV